MVVVVKETENEGSRDIEVNTRTENEVIRSCKLKNGIIASKYKDMFNRGFKNFVGK